MKILLADDHTLVRENLSDFLRKLDADVAVLEAGSFYEAVEIAARTLYLDMVILDMVMPGMDGFAGLEIMLKQCPQVPVVIMSGAANSKDMLQAINLGAAGFIPMVPS